MQSELTKYQDLFWTLINQHYEELYDRTYVQTYELFKICQTAVFIPAGMQYKAEQDALVIRFSKIFSSHIFFNIYMSDPFKQHKFFQKKEPTIKTSFSKFIGRLCYIFQMERFPGLHEWVREQGTKQQNLKLSLSYQIWLHLTIADIGIEAQFMQY